MEWHTLDDSLQRSALIEKFDSFIWTERFFAWGDLQITMKATFENRALLQPGTRVGMKGSFRVMEIETLTDEVTEDGKKIIVATGRSIEKILDDRVAMPAMAALATTPKWIITGTPGAVARYIFDQICVHGILSANDTIPFYQEGTFLAAGSIVEPADTFTIEFEPGTVYAAIQKVCQIWVLGFRLVKNDYGTPKLYFDIYTGSDRTSGQTINPAVIFSLDLESIDKVKTLKSSAALKTAAYVFATNGSIMVYADGYDSSVSGNDRRVLIVKADDIDLPAGAELNAAMTQRGKEELAKNRDIYAFDGEITEWQPYIYGIDYNLGDLVEERSPDGFSNYMIVTEQIFISDEQGERSYPTLVLSLVITPGSWDSLPAEEHWGDVSVEEHWGDL